MSITSVPSVTAGAEVSTVEVSIGVHRPGSLVQPLGPGGEENEASQMVLSWQLQKCTIFGRRVGAHDTDPRVTVVGAGAGLVDPEADIIRSDPIQA